MLVLVQEWVLQCWLQLLLLGVAAAIATLLVPLLMQHGNGSKAPLALLCLLKQLF